MVEGSRFRVYVDLEYIYPGMTREKGRPTSAEKRQIVQIAAIIFDIEQGKEVESFDVLTFPVFDRELPDFFVELTGITDAQLKKDGIGLSDGLRRFEAFVRDYPIYTFNLDEEVFRQNYGYLSIPFPFDYRPFTRVKLMLSGWGIDPDRYSSGTLHRAVGIEMQGHVHDALHDVRSMAAAVHAFERGARAH